MDDPRDHARDELARLAAELAELVRFEHESGGIGLPEVEITAGAYAGAQRAAPLPGHASRPDLAYAGAQQAAPLPGHAPRPDPAVLPGHSHVGAPLAAPLPDVAHVGAPLAAPRSAPVNAGHAVQDVDALLAAARRARTGEGKARPAVSSAPAFSGPPLSPEERRARLQELAEQAAVCTACPLHEGRTKSVFSRGSPDAELFFVGEGPGQNEDLQGEPFVGPAGQLLDKMIAAMGYARDAVYIANVVKCRPPGNRTPRPEEADACAPFLDGQLEAIRPRVIVALGRSAAERLGVVTEGRPWRGVFSEYRGIPVMATYHPAFLLRSPDMKRPVWEDLQAVMARLRGER